MPKKQLLWHLWSSTKQTSISKKYCRLFAIAEVLDTYSNMSSYSVKYISINILNKIPQMAVPKNSDYNQRGVKWNCSFAARFILSCKQVHFGSVVNVNTASNSDWALLKLIHKVTIWSASFSSVFFHSLSHRQKRNHDLALQSSKPARQKNISQTCNLLPAHFIQPTRCFHWQFFSSHLCTQSCC